MLPGKTVELYVPVHHGHGACRGIHAVNRYCTAPQCIDAEAAGIAEKIEHPAPGGIPAHQVPVLPLVQEETGLLPFYPVDYKLATVFADGTLPCLKAGSLVQITVYQIKAGLEWSRSGTLVVNGLEGIPEDLLQCVTDAALGAEHTGAVGLHDAYSVVPVDNQSRQTVAFPVHQPEAVGICRRQSRLLSAALREGMNLCPKRKQ